MITEMKGEAYMTEDELNAWHVEHPDNGNYGMRYDEADEAEGSFVLSNDE